MATPLSDRNIVPRPTWKQTGGEHIRRKLSATAVVIRLAVSEKYITLSLDNGTVHIFSAAGESIQVFQNQTGNVWSLALQGDVLLSGDTNGNIQCWDLEKCHLTRTLKGHTSTVRSIKFSDTTTAVSASKDGDLRIWNLQTGTCEATLSGHQDTIYDLVITGTSAASCSKDGTARLWSLLDRKEVSTLSGHSKAVWAVATDGKKLVTASLDTDVRVWELTTGRSLAILKGHTAMVSCVLIHNDRLYTSGADGRIIIWSLQDYSAQHTTEKAHGGAASSLDVRGEYMLSGGSDGCVRLWNSGTADLLGDVGTQTQAVWAVSLAKVPDKQYAIVASAQGTLTFPEHDGAFLDILPIA